MNTISKEYTTREFRASLPDVIGEARYGGKRVGVTRNGKLAAVVISPEDLELLEELEMAADVAAYDAAKADDDGSRTSLDDFRSSLGL